MTRSGYSIDCKKNMGYTVNSDKSKEQNTNL